ncbi:MAG: hypothetical protein JST79_16000 [Acidobacteria bacterium]|nr:hypothetical protein [Acidobacteriota bacterium]
MARAWMTASLLLLSLTATWPAEAQTEIFSIGVKDNSIAEFSRNRKEDETIVYRVGTSTPQKDWPAYQPGSFDAAVKASTMREDWVDLNSDAITPPFQVQFSLPGAPRGTFVLHLDAIVRHRRPAAPRYTLLINGKSKASYRLHPHPAPQLWWPNGGEANGNTQYFGYESLEMVLPASLFLKGTNTLALQCEDGFGLYYDRLMLSNNPGSTPPLVTAAAVEPTILYKNSPAGLREVANVHVRTSKPLGAVKLKAVIGATSQEHSVVQNEAGDLEFTFDVPAPDGPVAAALYIVGSKDPLYRGTFQPKRKWNVYALPMEQADFGYNDLPARTLEWENRFVDKTLQIQKNYPSYSFTLDAAANLESYCATRREESCQELLGHLKTGKWGINALYANFFTGLMTPEELYRSLDYSLRAGKQHNFPVDSASQTDEPSITWAMPQVLADAGIAYFTNGSDPIRGAFNPIGLLNFHSPFYWEGPTGAKVLVWSGVSYTAVDDMTWAGWNAESVQSGSYAPSIQGLQRSLPLFLSQYERDDFPFDAVLLFGLHNDEIPMRHWGDADVLEKWNREYAYPKVIASTQRDFFTHITRNFGPQIKTYRGDGGAYWEDEAGADARIAAMIRTSQMQILAAEKFESIAGWLQPHLKFDSSPFQDAWKNILLADSYVWSDANSFRRPYSYRTRFGEAAHRAWAEAAFQQTSDLRLVGMDKVAESIATREQGAVVFNPESWVRSGLFDFELEPEEILVDPETGQAIPCGVLRSHHDYQDVRCWANSIPAMGYKFYATAKGKVPEGKVIDLDPAAPAVENAHYRLQIDHGSGAVAHLIDKATGQDLVDARSDYGLNEYLYVSGGDPGDFIPGSLKDNRLLIADITFPLPELQLHHATLASAPEARRFPWGTVITVRASALNTPEIVTTIILPDAEKQVLFHNEVEKKATLKKEGVYFAFPFALAVSQMQYQGATAWVDPVHDMLPGANRQWFTTQGAVWGKGTNHSVAWATVDAPLVTLQDINRGLWPESIQIENGSVFSYVMNNYWYTDAPAQQGGRFIFRYALTSGGEIASTQAARLAQEQRSPFPVIRRYRMGWEPTLPESGAGFLEAAPQGVTVLTVRPLEDQAYLVRVQNTTSNRITASLQFPITELQEAYLGSVMGERKATVDATAHSVTLPMEGYEIKSLVVRMKQ